MTSVGRNQREEEEEVPTGSFGLQGGLQSAPICVLKRGQILRQQIVEYAVEPLAIKTGRFLFLPALSALTPGEKLQSVLIRAC